MNERKIQEEKYNVYRKQLSDQVEVLKKRNNELELSIKLEKGENEQAREVARVLINSNIKNPLGYFQAKQLYIAASAK